MESIFTAWEEFQRGKRRRGDVQEFKDNLEDNIFALQELLCTKQYRHGSYRSFYVTDPKVRHIHRAAVRDRLVHHALFRQLYPLFDPQFIFDSYSCRIGKGTHRAVRRLQEFLLKVSANNKQPAYVLKCDISKFFDSIDQRILLKLTERHVTDNTLWLVTEIVNSYRTVYNKGVPLGNVTSQLFANIYLNEFDQYVKHQLKVRHYIRYTDDFVIAHYDLEYLKGIINSIQTFLADTLALQLHPRKVVIRNYRQGVDFLGYVVLPYHCVLRTKTKRRMLKAVSGQKKAVMNSELAKEEFEQWVQPYLGMLKHCNGHVLSEQIQTLNS